jgi:O-acetyl-ADP-ribose deacetylase
MALHLIIADITKLRVDAIVNAAAPGLLGGGGVDGAIHRAAGPRLLEACRAIPQVSPGVRCPTGEARLTAGFDLPAHHVIHTVGPIWQGGGHREAELLANCYRNAVKLLLEQQLSSIAFPAISCGVYGYPAALAAATAIATLRTELRINPTPEIQLCCFNDAMYSIYQQALNAT